MNLKQNELLKKKTGTDSIPLPSDYAVPKMCKTPVSERVHALLYAHFNRLELADNVDQEDRAAIVTTSFQLVLGMLQIVIARDWFNCAKTLMGISQITTTFLYSLSMFRIWYKQFGVMHIQSCNCHGLTRKH